MYSDGEEEELSDDPSTVVPLSKTIAPTTSIVYI
jgi:hypothetical protein